MNAELVCIHDSARPLVDTEDVEKVYFVVTNCQWLGGIKQNFLSWLCFFKVLKDGWAVGAAVLGVPAKATIKEVHILQFYSTKT